MIEEFNGTNLFHRIYVKITWVNQSKTNAIFVHNEMHFFLQSYWEALKLPGHSSKIFKTGRYIFLSAIFYWRISNNCVYSKLLINVKLFLFYSEKDQVTTTELKGRMDWCPINLATLVLQTLFWVMTVRISSDFRASAENFSQCHHNFLSTSCLCAVLNKQLKIYNTIYHSLYFHVKEVCRRSF